MTRIDRRMFVEEALFILGHQDPGDVDALMRDTFKKAEKYGGMSILLSLLESFGIVEKGNEKTGYDWRVTDKVDELREKAEKWDHVVAQSSKDFVHVTETLRKLEAIRTYLKDNNMVVYDSFNRYSAQIITHAQGALLLAKVLDILEGEG